jgi:exonuclease SbcC
VAALAGLEAEKAQLEHAQTSLAEVRASQQQLAAARAHWAAALEQDQQRQAELSTALSGLADLNRQVQARQQATDNLRAQEGHARQRVGAAQQKLDYCVYLARERKDKAAQRAQCSEERSVYEELQVAFGKKGLQALIIESAIPEIESEANRLLARMTEGRMSVRFDTQRDTKSGGVIETLDLKIADEQGARSYEMYSGGEAFRVNLAVRIALSKLLARRAGARLQTLIIDEGFGTQDAQGQQRLVEAIHSIQDDFSLILVITHIEELRDAFPVRIDVQKTSAGSQITVN